MKPTSLKSEWNKMPAVDMYEKLPDVPTLKSYNDEYYNSLSNFKFINVPIENENKLLYHYSQNENASVSSTREQLQVLKNIKKDFKR